jgi:predicted PurR-regulated permease PerM
MTSSSSKPEFPGGPGFVAKVWIVVAVAAVILAIWKVAPVFMLRFGGIVVAVALDNIAAPLAQRTRLPHTAALGLTVLGLTAFGIFFLMFFGSAASEQFAALIAELPQAWVDAQAWLDDWELGRWLMSLSGDAMQSGASALLNALPIAGGLIGGIANAALMLVIGIYLAADPNAYRRGALCLLPPERRARADEILGETATALRNWLTAMSLDMLFLGTITGIGLWAVGVPLYFALAVLSGVSVFVPYLGPIVATVPGLLLALSVSPELALSALVVYVVAQQLEGNVSLPLLQRWTVQMPPAVMLLAMVGFGLLFGLWGILLATPLAVSAMTVIRMAYVEDVLEKPASEGAA